MRKGRDDPGPPVLHDLMRLPGEDVPRAPQGLAIFRVQAGAELQRGQLFWGDLGAWNFFGAEGVSGDGFVQSAASLTA